MFSEDHGVFCNTEKKKKRKGERERQRQLATSHGTTLLEIPVSTLTWEGNSSTSPTNISQKNIPFARSPTGTL